MRRGCECLRIMQESETAISKSIAEFLDGAGVFNLRLQSGTVQKGNRFIHLSKNGTPDRLFIYRNPYQTNTTFGIAVFCEVKRVGEKPSAEQLEVHKEIIRAGGVVLCVTSLDEFIAEFNRLKMLL